MRKYADQLIGAIGALLLGFIAGMGNFNEVLPAILFAIVFLAAVKLFEEVIILRLLTPVMQWYGANNVVAEVEMELLMEKINAKKNLHRRGGSKRNNS